MYNQPYNRVFPNIFNRQLYYKLIQERNKQYWCKRNLHKSNNDLKQNLNDDNLTFFYDYCWSVIAELIPLSLKKVEKIMIYSDFWHQSSNILNIIQNILCLNNNIIDHEHINNLYMHHHKINGSMINDKKKDHLPHYNHKIVLSSLCNNAFNNEFKLWLNQAYCSQIQDQESVSHNNTNQNGHNEHNEHNDNINITYNSNVHFNYLSFDESEIPIADNAFDLIISNLSLHYINDIQKTLYKYKKTLKKGGTFIATLFGGQTLYELRQALVKSDVYLHNSATMRLMPMISHEDILHLLRTSGMTQYYVNIERINVQYSDFRNLIKDLRFITDCLANKATRITHTNKAFFDYVKSQYYKMQYSKIQNHNLNELNATYEIMVIMSKS